MAWDHANYIEETDDTLRAAALRQHISEVGGAIAANVAKGSASRQSDHLIQYRTDLRNELDRLENRLAQKSNGFVYARLGKPN